MILTQTWIVVDGIITAYFEYCFGLNERPPDGFWPNYLRHMPENKENPAVTLHRCVKEV